MPERPYAAIASAVPAELRDLAAMLLANRTPGADLQHADWLAHTIAAASFGNRHLWLDLGLSGRDVVSGLLEQYFQPLYQRNTKSLKWKRFLFTELGALRGEHPLQPPGCSKCDQFPVCFPVSGSNG